MHDVVFLSYDEPEADRNFAALRSLVPHAKRVHGVRGIRPAHAAAADAAATEMLFVVDGDCEVTTPSVFEFEPVPEEAMYTHVWWADNPVVGLAYGNGAVKLFNRAALSSAKHLNVDFSTHVGAGVVVHPEVVCVTRYASTPLHAWRAAFREGYKLTMAAQRGDADASLRLALWLKRGWGQHGHFSVLGANAGAKHARAYGDPKLVNDFDELNKLFHSM